MPLAPLPITKKLSSTAKKAHLMMSDEVHDYSEIYTPSTEEATKVAKDEPDNAIRYSIHGGNSIYSTVWSISK